MNHDNHDVMIIIMIVITLVLLIVFQLQIISLLVSCLFGSTTNDVCFWG